MFREWKLCADGILQKSRRGCFAVRGALEAITWARGSAIADGIFHRMPSAVGKMTMRSRAWCNGSVLIYYLNSSGMETPIQCERVCCSAGVRSRSKINFTATPKLEGMSNSHE